MSSLLIKSDVEFLKRFQPRSVTDYLIDCLTPIMIFFMVSSSLFFLLDVRYIYSEMHYNNIRFVTLCFVMGVVALNRLVAQDNSNESPLYFIALAGAMGMYTFATTDVYDVGSVAWGRLGTPGAATALNMAIVTVIWWATNRLTHECCVDTNPSAGDIGILTGTARRLQKAIAERNDPNAEKESLFSFTWAKKEPVFTGMEIAAVDPLEYDPNRKKKVIEPVDAASRRLPKRHPGISIFYFSVPVMLAFALGLPALLQGGDGMVLIGYFYLAIYTFSALSLLMLSSLGGLREYFRSRRVHIPASIGPFWLGLGAIMIIVVMIGAARMPQPPIPGMAVVQSHQFDPYNKSSRFVLRSTAATPVQLIRQNRIIDYVSAGVLASLGLFFAYAGLRGVGFFAVRIARDRRHYPRIRRFFDRLDALLAKVLAVPKMPRFERRIRISRDVAKSVQYRNPLSTAVGDPRMRPRDIIEISYSAMCALAEDLGVPRERGETPYEFIKRFPRRMKGLKEEAILLTDLYVVSAYSQAKLDEKTLDQIRSFWMTYDKVRAAVIR